MPIFQQTFTTPGSDTFVVPLGVTKVAIRLWGAGGGGGGGGLNATDPRGGNGGGGGFMGAVLPVTAGQVLDVHVGGGGGGGTYGGPGISNGTGGGGGGATYIQILGSSRLVAGGGGGGGGADDTVPHLGTAHAGAGGGDIGQDGLDGNQSGTTGGGGGKGGTQVAGGAGGANVSGGWSGENGSSLTGGRGTHANGGTLGGGGAGGNTNGGAGGNVITGAASGGGGGGGAGYYGGGGAAGGAPVPISGGYGGGGGGGSNFATGTAEDVLNEQGTYAIVANSIDPYYPGSIGNGGAGGTSSTVPGTNGQPGFAWIAYAVDLGMVSFVTISGEIYPVYAYSTDPVADADAYLNGRGDSAPWFAATTDQKKQALVSAARWIDRVSTFTGTRTDDYQFLEWPRDGAMCSGTSVPDGTIPGNIVEAEFELALILISDPSAQDSGGQGSNIKRVKAGSAEVEYFGATIGGSSDTRLPSTAHDLIKCFLSGAGSSFGGGLASGTDTDSSFCDDDFDRTDGYY